MRKEEQHYNCSSNFISIQEKENITPIFFYFTSDIRTKNVFHSFYSPRQKTKFVFYTINPLYRDSPVLFINT